MVDQPALGKALESRATALGAVIHYQAGLRDIMCSGDTFTLMTEIGVCRARTVVNAAGVASADISADAGFPGYRIYPYVGEYCEIIPEKENLIREKLIYPALPPGSPTKGIHFLKTVSGKLFIGPNAKPLGKESKTEAEREATKLEMLASAQKFLPMLRAEDLRFSHSGVRAKTNPGIGEDDFVLRVECHNPTFVNALGIESPGVAASPEIADYLVDLCFGN